MKKIILITIAQLSISLYCIGQIENTQKLEDMEQKGNILFWNGTPYTGQVIKFDGLKFDKSKLRFDGHYINGQPNGHIKKWYSNYKLEYDEIYSKGLKEGPQIYYYQNGKKKAEFNYLAGRIADGLQNEWDSIGNFTSQKTYKQEILTRDLEYRNGVLVTTSEVTTTFDSNGQKLNEGWVTNNKKNRQWTEWYSNNRIKSVGEYINDLKEDKWLEYNENGNLKTVYYKNNEIDYYPLQIVKEFMKNKNTDNFSGLYRYSGKQGTPSRLIYLDCIFQNNDIKKYLNNNSIISQSDEKYLSKIAKEEYEKYFEDTIFYAIACTTTNLNFQTSQRNESRNLTLYNCYEVKINMDFDIKDVSGGTIRRSNFDWEFDTDGGLGRPKINRNGRPSDLMNNFDFTRRYSQMVISLIDYNELSKQKINK